MTSEPKAPEAPAIYLYRQVDRDDQNGRQVSFARIKVLTEEGRKYADVEIPFVKGENRVKGIKARTIQPDGSIGEFNGSIYEKTIVKAKGVRYLAKTFTLPDVRVGTIIEFSYTLDMNSEYIYDSRWILSGNLFTKSANFSLKPTSLFALQWTWPAGLPEGTAPPVKDGAYIRLHTQNVPPFQVEDYMPPENMVKLRVEFTYSQQNIDVDQARFWKKFGTSWYNSFDDYTNRRKAMEQAVAQLVSPSDTPEAKLQKIYGRVLQIRNTSFERERSSQEEDRANRKQVNNVEDVWKLGYGNSMEINWLFIALARAAGIDAQSVLVSSRASYFFDAKAMNTSQLNSDVVLVKLGGKDLYLDPGTKYSPFGLLPWYETGVPGLRLDSDGGQWVRTSAPESASAKAERKAELTLSEDGTLEGKVILTLGGMEALELRSDERDEDDTSRKTALEDLVKEALPSGAEVELTNSPDWISASPTLVAEYHLKVPGWVSGAGRRILFPIGLFGNSEKHVFEHADRVHALYFRYPYLKSDDITVTLLPGWTVGSVPNPITQDAQAALYSVKCEAGNGTLHLSRTLRMDIVFLKKDQYNLLRQFFQIVRTGDEQQVVLQPAS